MGLYPSEPWQRIWRGGKALVAQISSCMFYAIIVISVCNSAEFMKSQRQNLLWDKSREMLEDVGVFEASRSCTPDGAGSVPSNHAVLTVNSQHGVTKVLLESSSLPLLGFLEVHPT